MKSEAMKAGPTRSSAKSQVSIASVMPLRQSSPPSMQRSCQGAIKPWR
jgi:hypothetical protein